MFSHILVGSNDRHKSKAFYDATMGALGHGSGAMNAEGTECGYMTESGIFAFVKPVDGNPARSANGGMIAFTSPSQAAVDAWHTAGVANGGTTCEDPPGIRDDGHNKVYSAYLRDPDGNKLCAVFWMS